LSPFTVTIDVNTPFNLGWMEYVLGQPEPSVEESPDEHDGWIMAKSTQGLRAIHNVFDPQHQHPDDPAFLITVSRATPADDIDFDPDLMSAQSSDDDARKASRVKA
jgi:hypothetical protein